MGQQRHIMFNGRKVLWREFAKLSQKERDRGRIAQVKKKKKHGGKRKGKNGK